MMRLTRRWLLGLFGAAAAAPVLPKVAVAEAAATDQSIVGMDILLFRRPVVYMQMGGWNPGSLYSDELSRILKEQSQSWAELKEKVL